jgi:hypothetical protein
MVQQIRSARNGEQRGCPITGFELAFFSRVGGWLAFRP